MVPRVGVFIDVNDQFFRVHKKWEGKKLDYQKYFDRAKTYGDMTRALAYGTQIHNNASKFVSCLHHIGFEPRYKDIDEGQWYNWSVGMAIDMINFVTNNRIDVVIIGVSTRDIVPVVNFIKDKGVRVIIMGCGINKELKKAADHWDELEADMLELPKDNSEN